MKNIPIIGGAGKIFEIFVPGMFLLLNFAAAAYFFPFGSENIKDKIVDGISNPAVGIITTVVFGYLFGVVLRMIRTELADEWSAKYLRLRDENARKEKYKGNLYAYESFPYNGWMGEVCLSHFPDDVIKFYKEVWSSSRSRTYFNLCKAMVIAEDERSAVEIYSAESLCRYISGMFYALVFSVVLLCTTFAFYSVVVKEMDIAVIMIIAVYVVAIIGILKHYRFMRIKEVQTVFAASYKNKEIYSSFLSSSYV